MIVLSIIFGVILFWISAKIFKKVSLKNKLLHDKINAEAIVLSIQKRGLYKNNSQRVKLQMQIQPDKGRNFIAEINETISIADIEKFSVGSRVSVVYNPFSLKEVVLAKAINNSSIFHYIIKSRIRHKIFFQFNIKRNGVSSEAQRITGASKNSKQCSAIHAAISPPMPPVNVSSCSNKTFPVACYCFFYCFIIQWQ